MRSSLSMWMTAKQAAPSKSHLLRLHIWSRIRLVGYPKMIKIWYGRLFCCHWCLDMFLGCKRFLLLTYERRQSRWPYWRSHLLRLHIWSKTKLSKKEKIWYGRFKRLLKKNFQTPSSKNWRRGQFFWKTFPEIFLGVIFFLIFQYPLESLVVNVL